MNRSRRGTDFVIIGSGIFGCYAALFLKRQGFDVLLIEREQRPWQKASVVNQARLHFGYHYPRSIATAILANGHRERFLDEHRQCTNKTFTQYYAIDSMNSLTDGQQFERFCDRVRIPARRTTRNDIFEPGRIEALYETTEYSFDPYLIREHYLDQLRAEGVPLLLGERIAAAEVAGDIWRIDIKDVHGASQLVEARGVINATYANLNAVNRLFSLPEIDVVHEISEMVLVKMEALNNVGLTIMDGPFMSVMPYGLTGLHSLSSVLYTHHAISKSSDPTFSCQNERPDCRPEAVRVCTTCPAHPLSNRLKMRSQMNHYVRSEAECFEYGSLFTIKTKLRSSHIDDARPTDISLLSSKPLFFCIFSGKINSIYEIESVLRYV